MSWVASCPGVSAGSTPGSRPKGRSPAARALRSRRRRTDPGGGHAGLLGRAWSYHRDLVRIPLTGGLAGDEGPADGRCLAGGQVHPGCIRRRRGEDAGDERVVTGRSYGELARDLVAVPRSQHAGQAAIGGMISGEDHRVVVARRGGRPPRAGVPDRAVRAQRHRLNPVRPGPGSGHDDAGGGCQRPVLRADSHDPRRAVVGAMPRAHPPVVAERQRAAVRRQRAEERDDGRSARRPPPGAVTLGTMAAARPTEDLRSAVTVPFSSSSPRTKLQLTAVLSR